MPRMTLGHQFTRDVDNELVNIVLHKLPDVDGMIHELPQLTEEHHRLRALQRRASVLRQSGQELGEAITQADWDLVQALTTEERDAVEDSRRVSVERLAEVLQGRASLSQEFYDLLDMYTERQEASVKLLRSLEKNQEERDRVARIVSVMLRRFFGDLTQDQNEKFIEDVQEAKKRQRDEADMVRRCRVVRVWLTCL